MNHRVIGTRTRAVMQDEKIFKCFTHSMAEFSHQLKIRLNKICISEQFITELNVGLRKD